MRSAYLRSKQRRAVRASLAEVGSLNLVVLADILTAVVFFSLVTYNGAALAALTSFDPTLPPVVVTAPEADAPAQERGSRNPRLAVRVERERLVVEQADAGVRKEIAAAFGSALDTLQLLATEILRRSPRDAQVLVVPAPDVRYDDLLRVLERLRRARYADISLGSRAWAMPVALDGVVR